MDEFLRTKSGASGRVDIDYNESVTRNGYFSPSLQSSLSLDAWTQKQVFNSELSYCKSTMNHTLSKFPVGVLVVFTQTEEISAAMRMSMDGVGGEAYIVDLNGLLMSLSLCLSVSLCLLACLSVSLCVCVSLCLSLSVCHCASLSVIVSNCAAVISGTLCLTACLRPTVSSLSSKAACPLAV